MALANYGLLTGTLIDYAAQSRGNPHFVLIVQAARLKYQVAVNVNSTADKGKMLSALEWQIINDLQKTNNAAAKLVARIEQKALSGHAFTLHDQDPKLPTLDYVRDGVISINKFQKLSGAGHFGNNAFSDALIRASKRVLEDGKAFVAVLGSGYGSHNVSGLGTRVNSRIASFGFTGVENTHMNQGSLYRVGNHDDTHYFENGPNQDGVVLFAFSDGTAQAFFSKFGSQVLETDAAGNPVSTGIAELDNIPKRQRDALRSTEQLVKRRRVEHAKKLKALAAVKPKTPAVAAAPAPSISPPSTGAGRSELSDAGGFVFADTLPDDPNRPFNPVWDDSAVRKSPFVTQFASGGVPEAVPGPRDGVYPILLLDNIIGSKAANALQASGQIVFHSVGDTGASDATKLPNEDDVATMMVGDFVGDQGDQPAFLFHLGDVVYFYGEQNYYYDQFYKPFESYPAPIFAIPGNHDGITWNAQMVSLAAFQQAFCDSQPNHWIGAGGIARTTMIQPGVFFTLDAPLVSIIGLYSNCDESVGVIDEQQKQFLYNELVRLKKEREAGNIAAVLLAVHHPPLSYSTKKPSSLPLRDALDAACQTAAFWPDAVLSGHAHVYQRMTRTVKVGVSDRQIPYIISGSGGYDAKASQEIDKQEMASEDATDPEFRLHHFIPTYGYLRITVKAASNGTPGTVRFEFRSPNNNVGTATDTCVLNLDTHELM